MSSSTTALIAILLAAAIGGGAIACVATGMFDSPTADDSETVVPDVPQQEDQEEEAPSSDPEEDIDPVTEPEEQSESVSGLTITCVSGTEGCYNITQSSSTGEYTLTFANVSEDTEYKLSGTLSGCIVIDAGDNYDFKLSLSGVSITSSYSAPIVCTSANNLTISAAKGTVNTVTDSRSEQTDSDAINASVYCTCDLKVQGNGALTVVSKNNNGIHSKDDLNVKNLTLSVTCVDNALKGNDSVTIESGNITLTATSGDGIVTTSTDVSSKGVQRGTVTINSDEGDTVLVIDSYCDGIDAAYDVVIDDTEGNSVTVTITTYAGATASEVGVTTDAGFGPGGAPGGGWGGNHGGPSFNQPGPDSNPSPSVSFSCKGIKADNSVTIAGGTVTVSSYDDAIHANGDVQMESGSYGSGNVTISGGTVTLSSSDDAIHGDGAVNISGGNVSISKSYEGIEGSTVTVSGGSVYVRSSDDGINSSGTITLSGGHVMVYAGGDGIDSNCSTRYKAIVFSGAVVGIVSTSGGNSAIDTDSGYTYSGGEVLVICPQGMTNECLNCSGGVNSVGTYSTVSASSGSYLTVKSSSKALMAIEMPASLNNAFVLYLGSNSASFSTASSVSGLSEVAERLYARTTRPKQGPSGPFQLSFSDRMLTSLTCHHPNTRHPLLHPSPWRRENGCWISGVMQEVRDEQGAHARDGGHRSKPFPARHPRWEVRRGCEGVPEAEP